MSEGILVAYGTRNRDGLEGRRPPPLASMCIWCHPARTCVGTTHVADVAAPSPTRVTAEQMYVAGMEYSPLGRNMETVILTFKLAPWIVIVLDDTDVPVPSVRGSTRVTVVAGRYDTGTTNTVGGAAGTLWWPLVLVCWRACCAVVDDVERIGRAAG